MREICIDGETLFLEDREAWPGVVKTAANVRRDIELVTGGTPGAIAVALSGRAADGGGTFFAETAMESRYPNAVIYGTVGKSPLLEEMERAGKLSLRDVRGKREVYAFCAVSDPLDGVENAPAIKNALVIAGSDKRGTIYGLYHLSEVLGVSPLVNWNHVWPPHRDQVILTEKENIVSKEPSVKYRGFFINDEWPAFGNWAKTHFGGINAACYERVFELLLRLKGNYLWPAMWASDFSLDGPGLLSAQLADEYGVVMSTSHHEPCMRSGNDYGKLRGKGSVYGDAWDFRSNPEGIKRFWRDGLLRNRSFENVITLGMRGENDTAILGKDASLSDNIELLRSVLSTQNRLIEECVNQDLEQAPRQMVLFTEVEEFFYGNASTPGLMGDPQLEGVTLMLSDNNHGYTRTLPTEEMRGHKGGYGMYYHMDMHGGAHSFQWIGSTYLPRVWEQMTMAYEYGVREIWVTNIGDIGTQEFGLSYFLDLAYDVEKWGGEDAAVTVRYTRQWMKRQLGGVFEEKDLDRLCGVFEDYTGLLARRKHEVMHEKVYHPVHFGEAQEVLDRCGRILAVCDELKAKCPKNYLGAFISLVYYPACGTANLMRMWILTGRNALYAAQNRVEANDLAREVTDCLERDDCLTQEYHSVDDGYFYGFGLSEHIGFTTWCEENNRYPTPRLVHPLRTPRMIVAKADDEQYVTGGGWSDRPMVWRDALRPDVEEIFFDIACGSRQSVTYRIRTDCPWISFSSEAGVAAKTERIALRIHRERFSGKVSGSFSVENVGYGTAVIGVEAENVGDSTAVIGVEAENVENGTAAIPEDVFLERDGYICMEAAHFQAEFPTEKGRFRILEPYGRTGNAVKCYPVTADFHREKERPWVEYRFLAQKSGSYRIRFYMAPSTPVRYEAKQYIAFAVNGGETEIKNTVREDRQFFTSPQWEQEAYDNIKLAESTVTCREGINTLRFYAASPAIVLEKIVLWQEGAALAESYLGPKESWRKQTRRI